MFVPRGIRNNNPLNIEYNKANDWKGQTGSDGRFAIFSNPAYGFRAGARVLRSYQRRGIVRLNDIISTFAPANENNTALYIEHVSQWTGFAPDSLIDVYDVNQVTRLLRAMARKEVGHQYTDAEVREGVMLA
ncbi:virion protein [Photobacterium salinisoli]|uniref:virion protein n=1 Tax=Photobacterium salinisoli TaxID=1616783 RepID=UPI000EA2FF42|nr:virion protein [Photobacterium salinisoli]